MGANFGLWFTGSSLSLFAAFAFAYVSGSVPPTNQKTEGTCHSVPNDPKSSLAGAGPVSRTRSVPKCPRNASTRRLLASRSFTLRG